ncbi:MAG: hypothetical protein ABI885_18195 [Gammaproteobacteria bacterium]
MYKRNLMDKKRASHACIERREMPTESGRPLDDLITGYFFAAAEVLVQLEKEANGADSFLKS